MTSVAKGVNMMLDLLQRNHEFRPSGSQNSTHCPIIVKSKPKPRSTAGKNAKPRDHSDSSQSASFASAGLNLHNQEKELLLDRGYKGDEKTYSSYVECPSCQKIYTRRSLAFHLKVCSRRRSEEERRQNEINFELEKQKRGLSRPPGKLCYICGRRYTQNSWGWHEPKCEEQWNMWNARLPKELQHGDGLLKPNADDATLKALVEEERARGNIKFNRKDAFEKIMLEASRLNALPI